MELPNDHSVSLITELSADFTKSYQPDEVLRRYLQALRIHGELFIYLGHDSAGAVAKSSVVTLEGHRISLREWLKTRPGLEVTQFRGGNPYSGVESSFIRIRLLDRRKAHIPELELIGLGDIAEDGLPSAIFRELATSNHL
jgi:hypothetical protein